MQPHIEQGPSSPLERFAKVTYNFDNLNVSMVHNKEGKKNSKSHQAIKEESKTFISHKGSGFLSTPTEDNSNILGTKVLEKKVFYWMYLSLN